MTLRETVVALKRSIDPHASDAKRYEILRADLDRLWPDLVAAVEREERQ